MSAEQYGTDIGLQFDGNTADAHSDGADIGTTDGLDNLYQDIQNRLMTEMGSLPLHPTYGSRIHTLIGKGFNPTIELMVKMMVAEALVGEQRIASIRNIDVAFDRSSKTLEIIIDIVSIFSTELTVETTVGG